MRNGTKIGLGLIALAYVIVSTGLSVYAVGAAMQRGEREALSPRITKSAWVQA